MSLQLELDSDSRENLATTTFEQNPGCSRLKKYLLKINWEKEIRRSTSSSKGIFEKSELEIMGRFLNSEEPKVLHRMRMAFGDCHRFKHRSKIWNCMNIEEHAYQTACHEAGHVVSYWFTDGKKKVQCASIVPEIGFAGRVTFEKLDPNYVYTNNDLFSEMCCYMGGQIAQQMLAYSSRINLTHMKHDLIVLAKMSYMLAKKTMAEAGEEGPEELMSFFFRECHEVSHKILREHRSSLKGLSYALFAEKKLDYWDVLEILGPRPEMDKTLYEVFIKDKISCGEIKEKIITVRKERNYRARKQRRDENDSLKDNVIVFSEEFLYCLEEPISLKDNVVDLSSVFKEENL